MNLSTAKWIIKCKEYDLQVIASEDILLSTLRWGSSVKTSADGMGFKGTHVQGVVREEKDYHSFSKSMFVLSHEKTWYAIFREKVHLNMVYLFDFS